MRDAARALQRFFAGFGLPAYGKNDVPDGAAMPYITYEIALPPPMGETPLRAWVWTPGPGLGDALDTGGAILEALRGGAALALDDGWLALFPVAAREIGGVDSARAVEVETRAMRG